MLITYNSGPLCRSTLDELIWSSPVSARPLTHAFPQAQQPTTPYQYATVHCSRWATEHVSSCTLERMGLPTPATHVYRTPYLEIRLGPLLHRFINSAQVLITSRLMRHGSKTGIFRLCPSVRTLCADHRPRAIEHRPYGTRRSLPSGQEVMNNTVRCALTRGYTTDGTATTGSKVHDEVSITREMEHGLSVR